MIESQIKAMYESTTYTLQQIAEFCEIPLSHVRRYVGNNYSEEKQKERKKELYKLSKMGDKNPMKGKTGELHHNYKGDCDDGNGYHIVLKPEWFTGRTGSRHVFKHQVVICEEFGLTEIPEGCIVHHIDGDRQNNDISNLALMTRSAHSRLHIFEHELVNPIPYGKFVHDGRKH